MCTLWSALLASSQPGPVRDDAVFLELWLYLCSILLLSVSITLGAALRSPSFLLSSSMIALALDITIKLITTLASLIYNAQGTMPAIMVTMFEVTSDTSLTIPMLFFATVARSGKSSLHNRIHLYTYIHIDMDIHIDTDIHIHTYIHTYIHTNNIYSFNSTDNSNEPDD